MAKKMKASKNNGGEKAKSQQAAAYGSRNISIMAAAGSKA